MTEYLWFEARPKDMDVRLRLDFRRELRFGRVGS
jgi:hypothetical protein